MTKICRKFNLKRKFCRRALILGRYVLRLWDNFLMCSSQMPNSRYRMLSCRTESCSCPSNVAPRPSSGDYPCDDDPDLVALKISLLGDCQIGKTSFLAKYIGGDKEEGDVERKGLNSIDKTLDVKGARISYSIWEVDGDEGSCHKIPEACKDSVAIIIMFDLTSRVTLNGVIKWYQEARKWNQAAIPVIVGTKFDDFIQLPIDLQWTIASQARAYAKALNATLFFSSATYNINVNKIFKFITARLFDLPWTPERNLTVGEPIVDY